MIETNTSVPPRRSMINAGALGLIATMLAASMLAEPMRCQVTAPAKRDSSLWQRGELTGDWGGLRPTWKSKGFEVVSSLSQYYQGVAHGGIATGSEYNGSLQLGLDFDLGKMAGWQGWLAELKGEMRYGGPLLGGIGSVSPVNTAVLVPAAEGTVASITTLHVTKLVPIHAKKGDFFAVSVGR